MLVDLTQKLTKNMLIDAMVIRNEALVGHAGTHFDVMDKEFPLSYTERRGIVFDVRSIHSREIDCRDIDLNKIEPEMFVAFYTGYHKTVPYGEPGYFTEHPVLSYDLIEALLEKGISIIGLDFAGIRRTPEHIPADQRCSDKGVFVIENLRNLEKLLDLEAGFIVCTYPLSCSGLTGLPRRVIARIG